MARQTVSGDFFVRTITCSKAIVSLPVNSNVGSLGVSGRDSIFGSLMFCGKVCCNWRVQRTSTPSVASGWNSTASTYF